MNTDIELTDAELENLLRDLGRNVRVEVTDGEELQEFDLTFDLKVNGQNKKVHLCRTSNGFSKQL